MPTVSFCIEGLEVVTMYYIAMGKWMLTHCLKNIKTTPPYNPQKRMNLNKEHTFNFQAFIIDKILHKHVQHPQPAKQGIPLQPRLQTTLESGIKIFN